MLSIGYIIGSLGSQLELFLKVSPFPVHIVESGFGNVESNETAETAEGNYDGYFLLSSEEILIYGDEFNFPLQGQTDPGHRDYVIVAHREDERRVHFTI